MCPKYIKFTKVCSKFRQVQIEPFQNGQSCLTFAKYKMNPFKVAKVVYLLPNLVTLFLLHFCPKRTSTHQYDKLSHFFIVKINSDNAKATAY